MQRTLVLDTIRVSHMPYIDDTKLMAESRKHLTSLIDTTKTFSQNIAMSFGLDKFSVINMNKGKLEIGGNLIHDISVLPEYDQYKYLGIEQQRGINHNQFREKYLKTVTKLLNTKLNAKHLITVVNSWAIPALA